MKKNILPKKKIISKMFGGIENNDYICTKIAKMDTNKSILEQLSLYKANNAELYGIESLALVGSAARNEQREDSDIDILIKLKNTTFRGYMAIKEDMERIFNRKVDLISVHNNMRHIFVKNITRDAIYV